MKKYIIGLLTGLIIATSIGVYAAIKYQASEIEYNDTPLDEVLDDLYSFTLGNNSKKICKLIDDTYGSYKEIGSKYECEVASGVKNNFYLISSKNNVVELITEKSLKDNVSWYDAMDYVDINNNNSPSYGWNNVLNVDLPSLSTILDITGITLSYSSRANSNVGEFHCLVGLNKVYREPYCEGDIPALANWLNNEGGIIKDYSYASNSTNNFAIWALGAKNITTVDSNRTNLRYRPVITIMESNLYE